MRLHPDQGQYKLVETQIQQAIRRAQGSVGTPRDMMVVTGSGVATPAPVDTDDVSALLAVALVTDGDETAVLSESVSHAGLTGASLHDPKAHASSHSTGGADAVDVDNILPTQTGNSGKYLKTDGSAASWDTPSTGSGAQTYWCASELACGATVNLFETLFVVDDADYVAGINAVIPTLAGTGNVTFRIYCFVESPANPTTIKVKWSAAAMANGTDWDEVSGTEITSAQVNAADAATLYVFDHTLARSSLTAGQLLSLQLYCTGIKIVALEIVW